MNSIAAHARPVTDAAIDFEAATQAALKSRPVAPGWSYPSVAHRQGLFNIAGGLWPVLSLRSFEAVTGPKVDGWLVKTVGLLLAVIGTAQLRAKRDSATDEQRIIGMGTAGALLAIDLSYVARGRIGKVYLLDAVAQSFWLNAWRRATAKPRA